MLPNLTLTFQITLVGMGLVFLALILLWGTMEMLVRLSTSNQTWIPEQAHETEKEGQVQAALIAVTLALAERNAEAEAEMHEFPIPSTAIVSAWQAVNRTNMLNKRGQVR